MTNLLRSEFFRLFKSKSFYICAAVAIVLVSTNIFLLDWANSVVGEANEMYLPVPYLDGISFGLSAFTNGNVETIMAIITGIFVTAEFSHGTMKNVVSKGYSKFNIYFSKVIVMIAATFMIILATFIISTITGTIVTGTVGNFTATYVGQILKIIGVELLLNAALTSVLVLVAMTLRNLGGVIAVDIIGVLTMGPIMFVVLENLIKSKILIANYSLLNNIAHYYNNFSAKGSDYLRSIIVAIVFFALSSGLGYYAFKKSDIK